MAQFQAVNNDSVDAVQGDIVTSSGQAFGFVRAKATSANVTILGVWTQAAHRGLQGIVEDGLVEVNCEVAVSVNDKLYLSATNDGKASNVPPSYPYFLGVVLATRILNGVQKATLSLKVGGGVDALSTGAFKLKTTVVNSSPYIVLPTDVCLDVDTSTIPIQINLPAIAVADADRTIEIRDKANNASVNNITVHRNGADKIANAASDLTIAINNTCLWLKENAIDFDWGIV